MAIWSNKKNKKPAASPKKAVSEKKLSSVIAQPAKDVLLRPRITEKASLLSSQNIYVFDVAPRANKKEISEAVFRKYGFKSIKVNITSVKEKRILSRRGTSGMKSGGKKALVYLKKGDKIEIA
ncbi:MAG: 50S ribosomal protein L23 [Patescibacteria group bacterium]